MNDTTVDFTDSGVKNSRQGTLLVGVLKNRQNQPLGLEVEVGVSLGEGTWVGAVVHCQANIQCSDHSGQSPNSAYIYVLCALLHIFYVVKPVLGKAYFAKYKCNKENNKNKRR